MARLDLHRFLPHQGIASGTLEALKWLAVAIMTVDHLNRHLLGSAYPVMMQMGRLAMPLFALILAYNLARPEAFSSGSAMRTLKRLIVFAVLSSLPYMELNLALVGWRPFNILFTLAAGTACVILLERQTLRLQIAAVALFAVAGALVDYGWVGIGIFVCGWHLFRSPRPFWAIALVAFMLLLRIDNHNFWALAALPVFWLGFYVRIGFPRWRNALYYYFPLHLVVIVALNIMVFEN
jgi:TraX protein